MQYDPTSSGYGLLGMGNNMGMGMGNQMGGLGTNMLNNGNTMRRRISSTGQSSISFKENHRFHLEQLWKCTSRMFWRMRQQWMARQGQEQEELVPTNMLSSVFVYSGNQQDKKFYPFIERESQTKVWGRAG